MVDNQLAAYLYFISGVVSVIYAVSVHQARAKERKKQLLANSHQPLAVDNTPPADQQQPHADHNAPPADQQQPLPDNQKSQSGMKNRDLPQHGGGVPASGQPEFKP
jgi:hypothetical protein